MNKKAQIDSPIVIFVVIVFGLLLLAPILLKIFMAVDTGVGNSLGNLSGQQGVISKANFEAVMTPLINFWDKVIVAGFVLAILLLFVSAFLIDAHPFFVVLYIFLNFMLILFVPNIVSALDHIYDSALFSQELTKLVMVDAIRTHFTLFLVGIMVITGIIIYGKLAWFSRSNNRK